VPSITQSKLSPQSECCRVSTAKHLTFVAGVLTPARSYLLCSPSPVPSLDAVTSPSRSILNSPLTSSSPLCRPSPVLCLRHHRVLTMGWFDNRRMQFTGCCLSCRLSPSFQSATAAYSLQSSINFAAGVLRPIRCCPLCSPSSVISPICRRVLHRGANQNLLHILQLITYSVLSVMWLKWQSPVRFSAVYPLRSDSKFPYTFPTA
jgi:hypothetical protein